MEKENKILEILDLVQEKVLSPDEALPQILLLFSVSGQSELLVNFIQWLQKEYEVQEVYEMYADEYLQEKLTNSH
jgi:hypothetical protein